MDKSILNGLKATALKVFVMLFILGVINSSVAAIVISVIAVIALTFGRTDKEIIKMIKW